MWNWLRSAWVWLSESTEIPVVVLPRGIRFVCGLAGPAIAFIPAGVTFLRSIGGGDKPYDEMAMMGGIAILLFAWLLSTLIICLNKDTNIFALIVTSLGTPGVILSIGNISLLNIQG